ncbi:hypothetical protein N431DRAFT_75000 [Stipitochalara longipes BDJ]|nr:hypothetical protein N431DRAFT_75000 [Stipitochalara longipes BDJ]
MLAVLLLTYYWMFFNLILLGDFKYLESLNMLQCLRIKETDLGQFHKLCWLTPQLLMCLE